MSEKEVKELEVILMALHEYVDTMGHGETQEGYGRAEEDKLLEAINHGLKILRGE